MLKLTKIFYIRKLVSNVDKKVFFSFITDIVFHRKNIIRLGHEFIELTIYIQN